ALEELAMVHAVEGPNGSQVAAVGSERRLDVGPDGHQRDLVAGAIRPRRDQEPIETSLAARGRHVVALQGCANSGELPLRDAAVDDAKDHGPSIPPCGDPTGTTWPARRDSNPRPTDPKSVALIHRAAGGVGRLYRAANLAPSRSAFHPA